MSPTSHWWFAWPFTTVWSTLWGRSVWSKMLTRSRNSGAECFVVKAKRKGGRPSAASTYFDCSSSAQEIDAVDARRPRWKQLKHCQTTKPQSSVYASSRVSWAWVQQMLEGSLMYFSETGETVGSIKCLSAPGQADTTCFCLRKYFSWYLCR